jgi:acyl carrier protein
MNSSLDERIRAVFQRALRTPIDGLDDSTRRGEFEPWDSLGHLMLVQELSAEFQREISPEQALELETVADIKRLLAEGG